MGLYALPLVSELAEPGEQGLGQLFNNQLQTADSVRSTLSTDERQACTLLHICDVLVQY
jgi:hypothetical protein